MPRCKAMLMPTPRMNHAIAMTSGDDETPRDRTSGQDDVGRVQNIAAHSINLMSNKRPEQS